MKLPYEIYIGWRYTRSGRRGGRRNRFISFISGLSVAGIALGVAALILVLSVMNGFQKEVRDRMLAVLSHIEVAGIVGSLPDWERVLQAALAHPEVVAGSPFVSGQGMLVRDDQVRGVVLRGVMPGRETTVSEVLQSVRVGEADALAPGAFGIVLGREIGRQLGVTVGDRITLIVPEGTVTPAGLMPRMRGLRVVALFESGHYEYDSALALLHLEDAARLFRVDGASGVRLRTSDMQRAPQIAEELGRMLGPRLRVSDWSRENRNWFAAVQVEKRMMFIILTLIIAVAAFNLVSMLVMTVTDKQSDIAILQTLGARRPSISLVFIVQGALIGLFGTLAGVALGVLLGLNVDQVVATVEGLLGIQFLPQGVYFIDHLPSDLRWDDVSRIGGTAFALSLLATLYPSWRASRVRPAEALRYE